MAEQIDFFEVEFVKLHLTSNNFFCPITLSLFSKLLLTIFHNLFVLLSKTSMLQTVHIIFFYCFLQSIAP